MIEEFETIAAFFNTTFVFFVVIISFSILVYLVKKFLNI